MPSSVPHISVCVCTYQRPLLLKRLLTALARQETGGQLTYSIVVVDNDVDRSALATVTEFKSLFAVETTYCSEPRKNIALARNCAIAHATGEYIAFLDDDEYPETAWLRSMLATCNAFSAHGVLGPVRPYFDQEPPRWVIAGRFCDRPEHPTGTVMDWTKSRTGNLLFRRDILSSGEEPFRAEFGTGGEDVDFFRRAALHGRVFVWCNEAPVFEIVPPTRTTRSYMLKRALLRGRNTLKLGNARTKAILTSLVALPVYTMILPGALLVGQHVFVKYCIKFCDHLGRVLALCGMNPVKERAM